MRYQFKMGGETSQGIAFTWSRKQTLLRREINALSSVHFIFTIQNHPVTTLSHAVHKIFELQRLIPVHKALAKAVWKILPLFRIYTSKDKNFFPKIHEGAFLNFIRQKLRLAAAKVAQNWQTSHSLTSLFYSPPQQSPPLTLNLQTSHKSSVTSGLNQTLRTQTHWHKLFKTPNVSLLLCFCEKI